MKIIKVFLLLSFLSILNAQAVTDCSQVTEIPQVECEALIALYNSTDGGNWSDNSSWNMNNTPCSWYGVACDGGYVSSISLGSNNLDVNLPKEICNLSKLRELDLSNNSLYGSIPAELGNLENLMELNLSDNQISGAIPPELGGLNNLRLLWLYYNQLHGSIPLELGNLSNLEELDLSNNQLEGLIPIELGNLNNLKDLRLENNRLNGLIPVELCNLINMDYFALTNNQLSGSIPKELGKLSKLGSLRLNSNQLTGVIPLELGELINLDEIDLSNNQLAGVIPPQLGNLSNLMFIYLNNNKINGSIPSELGNLSNLLHLDLSENQLSGFIPQEIGNLSRLVKLYLHSNQLCGIIPSQLIYLFNIRKLTLHNNFLNSEKLSASLVSFLDVYSSGWVYQSYLPTECKINYTLTLKQTGSSSGLLNALDLSCPDTCQAAYPEGSEIALTATPDADSLFIEWQDCSNPLILNTNTTCTALFEQIPQSPPPQELIAGYYSTPWQTIAFKETTIGIPVQTDLKIIENGNVPLEVDLKTLTGTAFSLITPLPMMIPNGQTLTHLTLECTPTTTELQQGQLTLTTNDPEFPIVSYDLYCQGLQPPTIVTEPPAGSSLVFKDLLVGRTGLTTLMIDKQDPESIALKLSKIALTGDPDFNIIVPGTHDLTIDKRPQAIKIRCAPQTLGLKQAQLRLETNDPTSPELIYPLTCQGVCYDNLQADVQVLDFQTLAINTQATLKQRMTWASTDCQLEPQLELTNTGEFQLTETQCHQDERLAYCQTAITFTPTFEGQQAAEMNLFLGGNQVITIPVQGQALDAEVQFEITPLAHDFGSTKAGRGLGNTQTFTIENTGAINLWLESITLDDITHFLLQTWQCDYQPTLAPQMACQIQVQFSPQADTPAGPAQTDLVIQTNAQDPLVIPLSGTIEEVANCSDSYITLTSNTSGEWDNPNTWNEARVPNEQDTVLIQNNHEVEGIAFAKVRALCLEPNAILTSADFKGTALEIQATDYLENNGLIIGRHGADENELGDCTQLHAIDTPLCAQRGASVILKVGEGFENYDKLGDFWWYGSGGPLVNHGTIQAGNGGHGKQYSASGGNAIVLGRNTLNTNTIQAGNGGDLLTPQAGQTGRGGLTQIWGKLGGPGYLKSPVGSKVLSGQGGHCHPQATEPQTGGQGGNLWLVSLPDVYVDALVAAGQSDPHCTYPGVDGWVRIEPATINLRNAQITGGNVDIYGGDEFVIDLSHINRLLVKATSDITLAVGKGGTIDLRGNTVPLFETQGQINVFTDKVLLNEGIELKDLMTVNDPVQDLNHQGAKVLQGVSLISTGKLVGQPGEVVTVTFTLANNSPHPDTFALTLENALTWQITDLPETIEVPGLSLIELPLKVTIPDDPTQQFNIQATSQTDSTVTASTHVVPLTQEAATPQLPSKTDGFINLMPTYLVPLIPACPQNDLIDDVCNNQGQTLHSVTLTTSASVSGGAYSGLNTNDGLISQAQILPDAVVTGGRYSGYIENQGTLMNFTFVGAHLYGGTLGQTVKNKSKIGGIIENVTLLPDTQVIGGRMKGLIQGDPDQPALLEAVQILPDSYLRHVILGDKTVLHADVQLEQGVEFRGE